jgi:hypothetical protein
VALEFSCFLASLVSLPCGFGPLDARFLSALGAAAEKEYEVVSFPPQIHAKARTEIQFEFKDAGAYALDVRKFPVPTLRNPIAIRACVASSS